MSTTEWKDDFIESYVQIGIEQGREQGREQGAARARAQDVLKVLDSRGLQSGAEQRAQIVASAGLEQLDRWFERALLASSVDEVFKADDAS
jgi:hypothetical protein